MTQRNYSIFITYGYGDEYEYVGDERASDADQAKRKFLESVDPNDIAFILDQEPSAIRNGGFAVMVVPKHNRTMFDIDWDFDEREWK